MRLFLLAGLFCLFGWLWFGQVVSMLVWVAAFILTLTYLTGKAAGIRQSGEALAAIAEAEVTPEYIAQQREAAGNQ